MENSRQRTYRETTTLVIRGEKAVEALVQLAPLVFQELPELPEPLPLQALELKITQPEPLALPAPSYNRLPRLAHRKEAAS